MEGGECDNAVVGHRGRRGVRLVLNLSWKEGSVIWLNPHGTEGHRIDKSVVARSP